MTRGAESLERVPNHRHRRVYYNSIYSRIKLIAAKVSSNKGQATYIRVHPFSTDRESLMSTLPLCTSKTEILSFLGLAGYLCLWIPNFTLLHNPYIKPPEEIFQNP